MKIGIYTAIWQRHWLFIKFAKWINYLEAQYPQHTFVNIAVGSEGDKSKQIAESNNFHYTETENLPLSNKWNRGLKAFRKHDIDYIILLGSDDFIDKKAFAQIIQSMKQGYDLIGFVDCFFYKFATKKLIYWAGYDNHRIGETIGLGRCLSSKIIKEVDYRLWEEKLNSGLDGSMFRKVDRTQYNENKISLKSINGFAVDVKAEQSITHFELYKNAKLIEKKHEILDFLHEK